MAYVGHVYGGVKVKKVFNIRSYGVVWRSMA